MVESLKARPLGTESNGETLKGGISGKMFDAICRNGHNSAGKGNGVPTTGPLSVDWKRSKV